MLVINGQTVIILELYTNIIPALVVGDLFQGLLGRVAVPDHRKLSWRTDNNSLSDIVCSSGNEYATIVCR